MDSGDCTVQRVDRGTDRERLVVLRADDYVLASRELIAEMVRPGNSYVTYQDGRFTFGTKGEGRGVVTYEMRDKPPPADVVVEYPVTRMPEIPTIELRRIR